MPGRFFRRWYGCFGSDPSRRFNPFDARALLQAGSNPGRRPTLEEGFNPFDARALLQAPHEYIGVLSAGVQNLYEPEAAGWQGLRERAGWAGTGTRIAVCFACGGERSVRGC